jgi:hypothetical protein
MIRVAPPTAPLAAGRVVSLEHPPAGGADGEQHAAPNGVERLPCALNFRQLLRHFCRSSRLCWSEAPRRPGSHRRGHWFDPSIAHHLSPQRTTGIRSGCVSSHRCCGPYVGSILGAAPRTRGDHFGTAIVRSLGEHFLVAIVVTVRWGNRSAPSEPAIRQRGVARRGC